MDKILMFMNLLVRIDQLIFQYFELIFNNIQVFFLLNLIDNMKKLIFNEFKGFD